MSLLDVSAFEAVAGGLAVLGAAVAGFAARPAWPLSLGLALSVFSSHWDDAGLPVPLDRVFIGIGILSAVARARRADPDALRTRPIDWLLIVVAAWAVCSAVVAGDLTDPDSRFALLDRFGLVAFALFFVAPMAFREVRDRQILLGTLIGLGTYLGLDAVIETVGPRGLLFPRYIDDPSVGIHFDRARGPFAEAAAMGLALLGCAFACGVACMTWRDRRATGLATAVGLLCLLGTLLTLTRAIWVATALSVVLVLLATRETRRFVVPAAALAALLVVGAFAVIPNLGNRAQARADDDRPLWDRRNANSAALRMIADRPLLGYGWGRFRTDSAPYYRQANDYPLTFIRDVHNVYLVNAVELGLLGGSLWALTFLLAVAGGVWSRGPPDLRPWKLTLIGLFVAYAFTALTTPLAFTMPTLLVWTWAGLTWSRAPRSVGRTLP